MLTIQQLSQEVNIGVDTLRVWERRYGFPQPNRDSRGHRKYPLAQVDALRAVRHLQNLGYRPSKIFALKEEERRDILDYHREHLIPELQDYEALICKGQVAEIERQLRLYLHNNGLEKLVFERLTPIIDILDRLWVDGSLSIAREHLISDMLSELLREKLLSPHTTAQRRIVFLTLCGERHKLGLLMAAALFRCAGADCLVVQEELPLTEVRQLALDTNCHAVALSFSRYYSSRQAKKDLATLRQNLDPNIMLIAGGEAVCKPFHLPGLIHCGDLKQIPAILEKIK